MNVRPALFPHTAQSVHYYFPKSTKTTIRMFISQKLERGSFEGVCVGCAVVVLTGMAPMRSEKGSSTDRASKTPSLYNPNDTAGLDCRL